MDEVCILGLNPAWQRYFALPFLQPGGVHRLPRAVEYASGKGINCAHALRRLGGHSCCVHFLGGSTGKAIGQELEALGQPQLACLCAEATRLCTTLAVAGSAGDAGHSTELIEPSPVVSHAEQARLRALLEENWAAWKQVLVCGSFPLGCDGSLLQGLSLAGKRVYVDALQGLDSWMEQGVELLKVNAGELKALFGRLGLEYPLGNQPYGEAARRLRALWPVRRLVVTCGADGAWLVDEKSDVYFLPVLPEVSLRNAIGAGDAFLAGWVAADREGSEAVECFCSGAAAAQARCEEDLPSGLKKERYGELYTLLRGRIREYL